jgi:hypothetical protein
MVFAQDAGPDRMALGMVGIQEALRDCPVDHLGELPSQIHRILYTDVEALLQGDDLLPATRPGRLARDAIHIASLMPSRSAPQSVGRGLLRPRKPGLESR